MGYTYRTKSNTLIVCPYTGLQIVRVYNSGDRKAGKADPYDNCDWRDGFLVLGDGCKSGKFAVKIAIPVEGDDSPYSLLVRTIQPYQSATFEQFFKFGCKCAGYFQLTTVGVTKQQRGTVLEVVD